MLLFPVLQYKVSLLAERMFYTKQLKMFQILLKLTFCAIHLRQDLKVLLLLLLTFQVLKSKIRQYHCKLRDEFFSLVHLSVLQVEDGRFRMVDSGWFCCVASVSGEILFDMLFISDIKAPFTLPLVIKILNLTEILAIAIVLSGNFNLFCLVYPS